MRDTTSITLTIPGFRTLSRIAYICDFGAIWGFATFGGSLKNDNGPDSGGLLYVWVVFALVGSMIMVLKNRLLTDRALRVKVGVAELATIAISLVLLFAIPGYIGLLKGLAILVVFYIYLRWFFKLADARGL